MKIIIYTVSLLALSIIVFNLAQIDLENFFSAQNFNSVILIVAGLSCLIIMRIMLLNEKIKKIRNKSKEA
tara:strand:+ start:1658 stop:1867 length:210 start_codon:yes stop_codon:yes gene_type:complete